MSNVGMSKDMYDFIISVKDKVSYDLDKGIVITPRGTNGTVCSTTGYLRFKTNKKLLQVHQFLAVIYFGEECIGLQVNHIDGNKMNNTMSNLEVVTQLENLKHARDNGLDNPDKRTKTKIEKYGKKVDQLDLDGNYIRTYDSIGQACKEMNIKSKAKMSQMCNGIKVSSDGKKINSVSGYKWRFSSK